MILFPRFDGVLHPLYPAVEFPGFCYLLRRAASRRGAARFHVC